MKRTQQEMGGLIFLAMGTVVAIVWVLVMTKYWSLFGLIWWSGIIFIYVGFFVAVIALVTVLLYLLINGYRRFWDWYDEVRPHLDCSPRKLIRTEKNTMEKRTQRDMGGLVFLTIAMVLSIVIVLVMAKDFLSLRELVWWSGIIFIYVGFFVTVIALVTVLLYLLINGYRRFRDWYDEIRPHRSR